MASWTCGQILGSLYTSVSTATVYEPSTYLLFHRDGLVLLYGRCHETPGFSSYPSRSRGLLSTWRKRRVWRVCCTALLETHKLIPYREIRDDDYLHAFRIFRDRDSGGVRFEATARRGAMKTIPIWTAFVTQYIGSKGWIRRINSTTVQLQKLHPYVFCDNYTPPKASNGRYELTFTSVEG